ncbi:MAG: T9SS type A sorting domain-containing protein [Polaribacter sp.]|nr:T9SS type A sorting domain-containing protein [Polaribacter sp.]MDG1811864.1 T9SS type A sorting domain-containing protein [Polaribacter sp.]MDG1993014.1 T9SS type A sorting domain-containing protein [Polaribacter sp.]
MYLPQGTLTPTNRKGIKGITVQYVIDGQNPLEIDNLSDFKSEGIVKGIDKTTGKNFVTVAPEIPDIILRDPPGSNSFASIEAGTTISVEKTNTTNLSNSISSVLHFDLGSSQEIITGVGSIAAFVATTKTIEVISNTDLSLSMTNQQVKENTSVASYTFNQTISTSSDPDYVGADGDLYIGNAKNSFYGVSDDLILSDTIPVDNNKNVLAHIKYTVPVSETETKDLYISKVESFIIGSQPTQTFFMYSQKHLLETLIPNLETLAASLENGETPEPGKEYQSPEFYKQQAKSWRAIIQNNEKDKYNALNNKEALKSSALAKVEKMFSGAQLELDNLINGSGTQKALKNLIQASFFSNKSFDAGMGELTNTIETANLGGNSLTFALDISAGAGTTVGGSLLGAGNTLTTTTTSNSVVSANSNVSSESNTKFSYTLKDNDKDNVLSVDVVNLFDGNGPIFVTQGGATSCPYEGETSSVFYNPSGYNSNTIGNGGVPFSVATNKVYKSDIQVDKSLRTNVPESEAAVFTLLLKNTSETQSDLEFILDVDPISLNGAKTNLKTNGLSIILPFNETVSFPLEISKTPSSSTYKYEDIKIMLYSPCTDPEERTENAINITAEFKKSCSNVEISVPLNNWIFNYNEAYSVDNLGNTSINKLPITFTDFNTEFTGFQKIELQYRNATSSSWIKFATYYGSDALRAAANDKDKGIVIKSSDAEFTHNWDVVRDDIPDGNYEFRAVSYCTDDIVNTSAIVSGTININAPVLFGTPSPKDGILDVGEDILVRFNEDVLKRITSDIVAKGLKNQQEINHDVSVRLDGATNQIELPNQRLSNQSFTLQFWYKKGATSNGTLVSQQDGIQIALNNNTINFAIGGESITGSMNELNYNFYSFIYDHSSSPSLTILRNGDILATKSLSEKLDINTNTSIFIGGRGVEGNIHDIRLWSQSFTQAKATVAKDLTLTGRELNLQGYWRLDEGNGKKALDKAKRKNGIVNLNWDIFPKGNGYEFKNNSYLSLESVGFIQPSHLEDISLSFWIKPENTTPGTIFSNGVGDTSEAVMTNGYRNKWSFEYTSNGQLALHTEGEVYLLTSEALPVNTWSHVGVSLKRGGYLTTFIDGEEVNAVSANKIGGFSGNRILIGAKLDQTSGSEIATNPFTGKLDEIRFWNTARTQTLIARDRYFEINKGSPGLLLYVDFNKDGTNTTKGPTYHHADKNLTIGSTFSVMKGTSLQMYVDDSPAIKPPLTFTNIPLNTVINGDEMIIQPDLTEEEWSLFEGEVIRFSVERLTDVYFNRQLSPVTWTALVNKQELAWYTPTQSKEIVAQKNVGDTYSFVMDVVNIGGSNQPFTIEGIPIWLTATETTGSVKPNTNRQITFTVDKNLAMGNYSADIFLKTASGYNDRLSFDLRVLSNAPDWSVNPRDYNYSMNIIGKIKIDGTFSRDQYTKIGAFINGQPKGEAYLEYDAFYDSYFVYLTIYNENSVNDNPTFKIWDAVNGKIINSFIDTETSISFVQNMVLGSSSAPKIFSNSAITEQNVTLNKGWSWLSFYAKDANFSSLDEAFKNMELTEKDAIKSQLTFANYEDGLWNGNLTSLSVDKMYKVKLSKENNLRVMGEEIDPKTFSVNINKGWSWLPFPIHRNISLQEAMAFYEPSNGDVIKDQFTFAIYDQNAGWRGTLDYLESGNGYMIKSNTAQTLYYPDSKIYQKGAQAEKATATASTNNNLFRGYSSTMSIIATVEADIDFDEVRIYDVNNELRGVSDIVDIAGIKYSFITAFSNRSETLRFVLSSNSTEIDISRTFNFIDNNVLGSFSDPIVLTPVTLSDESSVINEISLYPNPFLDEITINFSSQNGSESKIEVFNVIGKLLLSQTTKTQQKFVINTAKLASGMYVVRITTDDGRIISKKIIKR